MKKSILDEIKESIVEFKEDLKELVSLIKRRAKMNKDFLIEQIKKLYLLLKVNLLMSWIKHYFYLFVKIGKTYSIFLWNKVRLYVNKLWSFLSPYFDIILEKLSFVLMDVYYLINNLFFFLTKIPALIDNVVVMFRKYVFYWAKKIIKFIPRLIQGLENSFWFTIGLPIYCFMKLKKMLKNNKGVKNEF